MGSRVATSPLVGLRTAGGLWVYYCGWKGLEVVPSSLTLTEVTHAWVSMLGMTLAALLPLSSPRLWHVNEALAPSRLRVTHTTADHSTLKHSVSNSTKQLDRQNPPKSWTTEGGTRKLTAWFKWLPSFLYMPMFSWVPKSVGAVKWSENNILFPCFTALFVAVSAHSSLTYQCFLSFPWCFIPLWLFN